MKKEIAYQVWNDETKELELVTKGLDVVSIKSCECNEAPSNGGVNYSEGEAQVILKNIGSSDHPSGMQEFNFTYERIGHRVFLDGRVRFGPDFKAGGGVDEFWLDIVGPEEIKPDFTQGSIESVGSFHGYGGGIYEGNAYWSTSVGSGKDGIRLTYKGQHVSKVYPVVWSGSYHWRISLSWRVP